MKDFLKKRYNILIPVFLLIVILIAVILYAKEYRDNRYAEEKDVNVYQYFGGNKMEYTAVIGRNKSNVILSYKNKNFDVNLDSTPIYLSDSPSVIFPKEMNMVFPLDDKQYRVNVLSEIYLKNDLYYLNIRNFDKTCDHAFLYDGKNTYFFIDEVDIVLPDNIIHLSPMSYVNCSYLNFLEYYDKESDTYNQIDITSIDSVIIQNDYMKVDVTTDKVIYEKDFTLLTTDFSVLKKITDKDE